MKKFLIGLVVVFLTLHIVLVVTNNTFLYKAVANTYLKGRTGASIDNYLVFENRKVEKGTHQPWAIDSLYNTKSIPEAYIKEMDSLQTIAYLIIKNDSIIHEQYWDDYGENSLSGSFSMAKSMVAMLIGVAIDEGKIKSVDQKVSDFLPSFKEGDKAKITIKHLLTMSSGMGFDEHYKNPFSYTAKGYFGTGLEKLTLKQEAISEPGVKWKYLSGNSQLLALIIEAATGDNVSTYLSNKLWKPMGAKNDALWSIDQAEDGVEIAYCCMNSSARDFARFGKLMLGSGKWNGNQLISANYIAQLTSPANILDNRDQPNQKYGYQTWLIPNYKGNNIYYMRGILGQYVICLPEKNMIIVRLGHKRIRPAVDKDHPSDLFNYIDMALEMYN